MSAGGSLLVIIDSKIQEYLVRQRTKNQEPRTKTKDQRQRTIQCSFEIYCFFQITDNRQQSQEPRAKNQDKGSKNKDNSFSMSTRNSNQLTTNQLTTNQLTTNQQPTHRLQHFFVFVYRQLGFD